MKRKGIMLLLLAIAIMVVGCEKEPVVTESAMENYEVQETIVGSEDEKFFLTLDMMVFEVTRKLDLTAMDLSWSNPIGMEFFSNQGYTEFSLDGTLRPVSLPVDTFDGIYVILGTVNDFVASYNFTVVSPSKLITGKEFLEFIQYKNIGELLSETPTVRLESGGLEEFVEFNYTDCKLVMKTFDWNGEGVSWEDSVFMDAVLISKDVLSDSSNSEIVNENEWFYSGKGPAPFSMEEFWDLQEVDTDWYDNGIFSSYMEMAYPADEWEYTASIYVEIDNNPMDYQGFQIYTHQCTEAQQVYRYLVPIPIENGMPAIEVYYYDAFSNYMYLVWYYGELVE